MPSEAQDLRSLYGPDLTLERGLAVPDNDQGQGSCRDPSNRGATARRFLQQITNGRNVVSGQRSAEVYDGTLVAYMVKQRSSS